MQREQTGTIVQIGSNWHLRWWERRNISGTIERKRVSHRLGAKTTRGRTPPAEIVEEAKRYMNTISRGQLPAERIITIEHFVTSVYLEWIEKYQRPSTLKGYRQVWKQHLQPHCGKTWLKETRTYMVQGWLNAIAKDGTLSRNSLKRIQSTLSGVFSLAKRLGYYDGVNPVQDTRVDGAAAEAAETYAYSLEECEALLRLLPEPAATAFAVACFTGLRIGEIEALEWQDFHDGDCTFVDRSGMATSEHPRRGEAGQACR